MNGAKPGASACFWVKGGAGVLVGRSVSQSINQSVVGRLEEEGGKWRAGARVIVVFFNFDLRQREKCFSATSFSGEKRRPLTERRWTSVIGFVQFGETMGL